MNTNIPFVSSRKFYDVEFYPHGFHRSGEFTCAEAAMLEQCGAVIRDLAEARHKPASPEEHAMLAVINGEALPQTPLEHLWCKYRCKVRERKSFLACALRPSQKSGQAEINFT